MTQDHSIETERMTLRSLRPSDAGLLSLYAGDARVAQMTASIPHPLPPGAIEAFIERSVQVRTSETVWALDATKIDGPELIGVISVDDGVDIGEEVGYWVGPPFWNTGYGTEALEGVIAHRFDEGVSRLTANVFQDNPQSAQVLLHCGFVYTGDGEGYSVARGAVVAHWEYKLEREQWLRRAG